MNTQQHVAHQFVVDKPFSMQLINTQPHTFIRSVYVITVINEYKLIVYSALTDGDTLTIDPLSRITVEGCHRLQTVTPIELEARLIEFSRQIAKVTTI